MPRVRAERSETYLTYDGSSWSSPKMVESIQALGIVSCTSKTFCAADDFSGDTLFTN
jgi:hypothetical protein